MRNDEAQDRADFPLETIAAAARRRGGLRGADFRDLADETGLPESAVRAAWLTYPELHAPPASGHRCVGTACLLAGHAATTPGAALVSCLGGCDRGPTVLPAGAELPARLDPDGRLTPLDDPAADVRCLTPTPVVLRRLRHGDASELETARRSGAWSAIGAVRALAPEAIVALMEASGERGRGGAGFPTARKWRLAAAAPGSRRFIVANGDEGDPGSFVDRVLMERDPHAVLEGMAIAAAAVGAAEGIVFVRAEYPRAARRLEEAIDAASAAGLLGADALGPGRPFRVRVARGHGGYVCGEETALIDAMEGGRGEVRLRPPYPVERGYLDCPTVVNNVETLAAIPWIVEHGPEAYRALGTRATPGTKALCLSAGFARPGLVEAGFETTLRAIIDDAGGGRDGPLAAVLLGGPMGCVLTPDQWDVPICLDALAAIGGVLGHGGLVAIPERADPRALARHLLSFAARESCGRCAPCSYGSVHALGLLDGAAREGRDASAAVALDATLDLMQEASVCAFGREIPRPVRQFLALAARRPKGGRP